MVTRSPFSAWVSCSASDAGARRTGAMPGLTSNTSPSTKRAALTLPSRYFAATSGLAGVRRGSSIALAQQFVDRACGLALAAFGPAGLCRRRPTIDVDMQPAFRSFDKALQEQRAGDRAGEGAGRRVGDGGDLRVEPGIVSAPQRHAPQRIVLLSRQPRDVSGKPLIIGVKGR